MDLINLSLFGGLRVWLASGPAVEIRRKKGQALLAYLARHSGQRFRRDKIASLLWGDLSDEQARQNLRQTLFSVRSALPDGVLLSDADTVGLASDAVEVDVVTYERLAAEATPEALAGACSLYCGDFLDGFVVDEAPFEEWLQQEREGLRERALEVFAKLLSHQMGGELLEPAIQTALRLLALDPLQETTHRTLMRLYVRQGRRAAALRQYQLCVDVLRRELDTEPEAATRQLYQEILPERMSSPMTPASSLKIEPHRRRPGAHRRRASRISLDAPLVGRVREMERLRRLLHEARAGHGTAIVIVGEAGVGKTRIVEELQSLALRRDVKILSGRAYETAQVLPFGLWGDALRIEVVTGQSTLQTLDAVWQSELSRLFPELPTPEPASTSGDPLRLFEAIARFIARLAEHGSVMLTLEDLHWADEMSLRLLAFLGRRIAKWGVLLVCTAREEYVADLPWLERSLTEMRQHAGLAEIILGPLSREDTRTLVRSVAPVAPSKFSSEQVEDRVWQLSEGNPFVALATLRVIYDGAPPANPPVFELPTPARQLILAHLGRLSARGRQLVGIASVIGREFDFALLQCVAGLADLDAAEAAEELVRRRIFRGVNEHLDFTHDRIREAALGQLLPVQRRLLHREIGGALETVYAHNLEPHYAALARHFRDGGVFDKAVTYLRKAAAQARTRFVYYQAAAFLEQALDALGRMPETRDTIEQAIDVRCDLRMSLNPLADDRAMLNHLQVARSLAEQLGDRRRLVRTLTYLGREYSDLGAYDKAIELVEEARAVASALRDRVLEVAPTFYVALSYSRRGDAGRARDVLMSSVDSIPEGQRPDHHGLIGTAAVFYRTLLSRSCSALGRFDEGIMWGQDALQLAEAVGHPYGLGSAYLELGSLYFARGAVDAALGPLERGLDLGRTRDLRLYIYRTAATLAWAYASIGRVSDARNLLDAMPRESFGERPKRSLDSLPLLLLGETHLALDRRDEAEWFGQRALAMAREFAQREVEALSLRLRGDLLSRHVSPDPEKSTEAFSQALSLAEQLGLRPLMAHCNLGLGQVSRRRRDEFKARDYFTSAVTMYREMGITDRLKHAEAELVSSSRASTPADQ